MADRRADQPLPCLCEPDLWCSLLSLLSESWSPSLSCSSASESSSASSASAVAVVVAAVASSPPFGQLCAASETALPCSRPTLVLSCATAETQAPWTPCAPPSSASGDADGEGVGVGIVAVDVSLTGVTTVGSTDGDALTTTAGSLEVESATCWKATAEPPATRAAPAAAAMASLALFAAVASSLSSIGEPPGPGSVTRSFGRWLLSVTGSHPIGVTTCGR